MKIPFTSDLKPELDPIFREEAVAFFKTDSGEHLLEHLAMERPPADATRADFSLGAVAGYEQVFINLKRLLRPEKPLEIKEREAYPDPDDDSHWPDAKA